MACNVERTLGRSVKAYLRRWSDTTSTGFEDLSVEACNTPLTAASPLTNSVELYESEALVTPRMLPFSARAPDVVDNRLVSRVYGSMWIYYIRLDAT